MAEVSSDSYLRRLCFVWSLVQVVEEGRGGEEVELAQILSLRFRPRFVCFFSSGYHVLAARLYPLIRRRKTFVVILVVEKWTRKKEEVKGGRRRKVELARLRAHLNHFLPSPASTPISTRSSNCVPLAIQRRSLRKCSLLGFNICDLGRDGGALQPVLSSNLKHSSSFPSSSARLLLFSFPTKTPRGYHASPLKPDSTDLSLMIL